MSALAYPLSINPHRPHLRLVSNSQPPTMASVYRRRRVVALLFLAAVAFTLVSVIQAGQQWVTQPRSAPVAPMQPVSAEVVIVQPGDSLWSIATRAHPGKDVRPYVAEMARSQPAASLQVGDRVSVPR